MSRVKRAVAGRKKRQTLVERTKGYYGTSSRTFRGMKEQAQHSGQYQYRSSPVSSWTARFSPRSPTATRRPSPTSPTLPRRPSPTLSSARHF